MNIIFPTVTIIIARNLKSIKNIRNTSPKNTTSTITMMMMMTIDRKMGIGLTKPVPHFFNSQIIS